MTTTSSTCSFGAVSSSAVWVDGRLVAPDEPHLRADDHGIVVGDGVFETLLVVPDSSGTPAAFALQRHLDRLRDSANALCFDLHYSDAEVRQAVKECLEVAPAAGIVRITVTSGIGPLSSARGTSRPSTIVIASGQPPKRIPATTVAVVPYTRNESGATTGVKTTSYAENVLALHYAKSIGATEAIFADTQGRVSEGTGSNIFWSDGERLHTPPLDTGCLAGVTRSLIMEQVDVTETHLDVRDLPHVREAFLSSSLRVVQSIATINDTDLAVVDGALTIAASEAVFKLMATNIDP